MQRMQNTFALALRYALTPLRDGRGAWYPFVREPYAGAWQRNDEWTTDSVLAHPTVYACITLIASDIGKLRPKLVERDENMIWEEVESPTFSNVLNRPNRFQNHIQFKEWWIISKLVHGNTYVLKERDNRGGQYQGAVRAMYLLDPMRVKPLISPDGDVFYQLSGDDLSGVKEGMIVPASEIIHDRMNCLFHPLVGISPLFAAGSAAQIGLNIQRNSSRFFGHGSNPSGILTAPGVIKQEEAEQMSARWQANFAGENAGKVAVLGNGLSFTPLRMTAVDSQLIEHLQWSDETICRVLHVPTFKVSAGVAPTYANGEISEARYYSDCLQSHIEHMELALDEGLGLTERKEGKQYGVELDLDGLLRMDTATQIQTLVTASGGAIMTPDEARERFNLKQTPGGNAIYKQQQDYSLEALAERDANKPFAKPVDAAPAVPALAPGTSDDDATERMAAQLVLLKSTLQIRMAACQLN